MAGTYDASKTKKSRSPATARLRRGTDTRENTEVKPEALPTPMATKKRLTRAQRREARESREADVKRSRLIARCDAEIVYRPTHFAPPHPLGVDRGGRGVEVAVPKDQRNALKRIHKTDVKRVAEQIRRNSVRYKKVRALARAAGTYDPSSVGKPGAFRRPACEIRRTDVRSFNDPHCPVRAVRRNRVSRRGYTVILPPVRYTQDAPQKEHRSSDAYNVDKSIRLGKAFAQSHTSVEYRRPTGGYTAQLSFTVEKQLRGMKRGKERWHDVVVWKVENFKAKTQSAVAVLTTSPTCYAQEDSVKVDRVNVERIANREAVKAEASAIKKAARAKKVQAKAEYQARKKAAMLALKAAA